MAGPPNDESGEFIEQGRWLLEWHNRRAEAFTSRAVAILGFDGVILALLLQGIGIDGLAATGWTWAWLILSIVALLVTAFLALLTIMTTEMAMPGVSQLRHWWKKHAAEPRRGFAGPQIAESLLHSKDLAARSPVSDARAEADMRAKRFKTSIATMLAALVFLSCLLFNVMSHA